MCADRFDLPPSPTEGRNNEGEGEWKCYPHRECPCRPFLARALQLPQPPHSREGDRRKRGLSLPMHAAMMDVRGSLRPIPLAQARGWSGSGNAIRINDPHATVVQGTLPRLRLKAGVTPVWEAAIGGQSPPIAASMKNVIPGLTRDRGR